MKFQGRVYSLLPIIDELGQLPGLNLQDLTLFFILILIASLRIGAFLIAAPFFGSRMVPLQIRIVFSFCLGFWILDVASFPDRSVLMSAKLIPIIFQEIIIGVSAGMVVTIAFASVSMAGEKIAATSGLAFASQVDPTGGGQSPVISSFLTLFMIVIFFAINGHLVIFGLIYESFEIIPIGKFEDYSRIPVMGLASAELMLKTSALLMLPIVSILFLVNVSIGFITKSAPQLNLFSFGFPMTILGAFFILYFSVDALAFGFQDLARATLKLVSNLLLGEANGG
jgi:flagellar biosynthetic protein FliR|tara:strand:+ start:62 stop:910 length:849 start_codon:yes stop_codon:yes gene_type:complete